MKNADLLAGKIADQFAFTKLNSWMRVQFWKFDEIYVSQPNTIKDHKVIFLKHTVLKMGQLWSMMWFSSVSINGWILGAH